MTRRIRLSANTLDAQRRAADPEASIWVSANAGAGKTHVLTQRVLRLLLSGVAPATILCLTYTKAAAAEMRRRVSAKLADWTLLDDRQLDQELALLEGASGPDQRRRARALFAHALETPGGLKIQTIHAFCESVLHRFPIEAGVPFDFAVIEEDERANMVLRARERVLAEGLKDSGRLADAVGTLFGLMTDFAIATAIDAALAEGRKLRPVLADREGAKLRLRRLAGFAGRSSLEIEDEMLGGRLIWREDIERIVAVCPPRGKSGFEDRLARLHPTDPSVRAWLGALLTADMTVRKNFPVKALCGAEPEIAERARREAERLALLCVERSQALLIERSEALLDVLGGIADLYEAQKRARSLLDFDDLIEKLGALFADEAQGPWVQYKLDAGITHVLVDESQDTNEEQWRVVRAIAREFFTGDSAITRPRTLFAVGDQKQSIYSFQGADPRIFGIEGHAFEGRALAVQRAFARVPLNTSFRSLPEILAAVDLTCARPDVALALLAEDPIVHDSARPDTGGTVTLWPPLQQVAEAAEDDQWPLTAAPSERSAPRQVAERIARTISGWIDQRRVLPARNRAVRADDILILVQSRGPIFFELIRALSAEGLPTPGADRLDVTGHIGVRDLLVLADVLLNPSDDLGLATLLRSPLYDWSEDELFAVAQGRTVTLWRALRESDLPKARKTYEELRRWRDRTDLDRPFEFFARVLYAEGGLKRMHQRMGSELDDAIGQFLELALAHEQTSQPSLQGFVVATRKRALSVKRELAESGTGVRVMTVHGAKGLEAPIVFLADAASKPQGSLLARPVHILPGAPGPLLIHAPRSGDHVEGTMAVGEAHKANQQAEYWRKLYVAMTRAEDELYVTGALTPAADAGRQVEGTWFEAIRQALEGESERIVDGEGKETALIYPRERAVVGAGRAEINEAAEDEGQLVLGKLPTYRPAPYVQPSGVGADSPALARTTAAPPPLSPPRKGEGDAVAQLSFMFDAVETAPMSLSTGDGDASSPSPLRGGDRGGGRATDSAPDPDPLATAAESLATADRSRREGIALHALLQHLTRVGSDDRPAVATKALAVLLPEAPDRHPRLAAKALSILAAPALSRLFGPHSRAEVPFLIAARRDSAPIRLAGRIDRLVVDAETVLIVDFKSDAKPPATPSGVPPAYLAQLGIYALVAGQLFPDHRVETAILWTALESLMFLPRPAIAAAAAGFTLR